MNDSVPSKKLDLIQRIEDSLLRLWVDRVVSESSARGLLREAADMLRASDEPPVDRILDLISSVDDHLANAKWDVGGTARKRLREACELLRAAQPPAIEPPADDQIDYAIRLIEERELSMDDSEGIVGMLQELKRRRATEPCEAPSRYAFMVWAKTQGNYNFRLSDQPFRTYHHELTEHAWRGWANGLAKAGAAQPPGVRPDPNEGPIGPNGLLVVDGGVLPPFYNSWKCSQCGKDPDVIKANGPCSCGRGATSTKEGGQ